MKCVYMIGFEYQLGVCHSTLDSVTKTIDSGVSFERVHYKQLYDELNKLSDLLPDSMVIFKVHLKNIILPNLKLRDLQQMNQFGQMVAIPRNGINPFILGQVIATMHYITAYHDQRDDNGFWAFVHESIINSSKDLFDNGHYAESVEAAFLEITVRVKNIMKTQTGEDLDGTAAMQKAFSLNNPIIQVADISSRTGKDIQQGVMELLTGSIRYIRNPKAHEKIVVEKHDAVRKLHLASLLMNEIDKANVL